MGTRGAPSPGGLFLDQRAQLSPLRTGLAISRGRCRERPVGVCAVSVAVAVLRAWRGTEASAVAACARGPRRASPGGVG